MIANLNTEGMRPTAIVELYKSTLQSSYGNTDDVTFDKVCMRKFKPFAETIDSYGSDIRSWLAIDLKGEEYPSNDRVVCLVFWRGMPDDQATKHST